MAVPKTDSPLAQYSTNFERRGTLNPAQFDFTPEQMARYSIVHQEWMASYTACESAGGKCAALVARKRSAKGALLPYARELYARLQHSRTVSNENKLLMGVTIKPEVRTRRQAPALAPLLTIVSVTGRTVFCRIADATAPTTHRRPFNAAGAMVLSFAGPNPPRPGEPGWKTQQQTGRNAFEVTFDQTVAPGTPCWVTVRWYSRRGEYSPLATLAQTYLQIGPVSEARTG